MKTVSDLHGAFSAAGAGSIHGPRRLREVFGLGVDCLCGRNYTRVVDGGDGLGAFRKADLSPRRGNGSWGSGDN
jgi:hypothetical protein